MGVSHPAKYWGWGGGRSTFRMNIYSTLFRYDLPHEHKLFDFALVV